MARKIQFPLKMGDGTDVRDITELRTHADEKSLMVCFLNGSLERWLKARNMSEADKIAGIDKNKSNAYEVICKILNIKYNHNGKLDIKRLDVLEKRRNELLQITDKTEILNKIENVAYSQDELEKLVEKGIDHIYLYGGDGAEFNIPCVGGITYEGVKNPQVNVAVRTKLLIRSGDIKNVAIALKGNKAKRNKPFATVEEYFEHIKRVYGEEEAKAEADFFCNNHEHILEQFTKLKRKGVKRANYFLVELYREGLGDAPIDYNKEKEIKMDCGQINNPLAKVQFVYLSEDDEEEYNKQVDEIIEDLLDLADLGDPFACDEIYWLVTSGYNGIRLEVAEEYIKFAMDRGDSRAYIHKGIEALYDDDYTTASRLFQEASKLGNARADYELGNIYEMGYGVEKNYEKAVMYYRRAAEKNMPDAQCSLGVYHYNKDEYNKAFAWYEKAARKNHAGAMNYLGVCYQNAIGCSRNMGRAFKCYLKAAEYDAPMAYYNVACAYYYGEAYEDGEHPVQNYEEAVEYFYKAAAEDIDDAMYYLGVCYQYGLGVNVSQEVSKAWYQKAADLGNEEAKKALNGEPHQESFNLKERGCSDNDKEPKERKEVVKPIRNVVYANSEEIVSGKDEVENPEEYVKMGVAYLHGDNVEYNPPEAYRLFLKAKNYELPLAYYWLGNFYIISKWSNWPQKAFDCYFEAAPKNHPGAQRMLGLMIYNGDAVRKDYILAFSWFEKAAENGDAWGKFYLGLMYYYSDEYGVKRSNEEYFGRRFDLAFKNFKEVASEDNTEAMYFLGCCYLYGRGVEKNVPMANEMFRRAKELGHEEARKAWLGLKHRCQVKQGSTLFGLIDTESEDISLPSLRDEYKRFI